MKFNQQRLVLLLLIIGFLSSCLPTNTPTTVSSDASFVSLTLAGNDSVKKAVFTLNGSVIENLDSLPYQTRIDSVYPTFSFKSTSGAFFHLAINQGYKFTINRKDSAAVTGKDTIDFRQPALTISNFASDGKAYKSYYIKVNVHKIQPELYIWNKITDNVNSINAKSQKTIILNDKFYYYLNDGTSSYLYNSNDGYTWSASTVNGLPTATSLTDMIQFNGRIFVSQDGFNLYSSANGSTWTKKTVTSFTFKSLAFVLNGSLWAVVQSTDLSFHFATSIDGDVWSMIGTIPTSFPVKDFATVTLATVTGKQKVVVIGGYSQTDALLKNSWSSEDGLYWVDFSTENHTLDSLAAGASLISYDKKLLLVGKNNLINRTFYRVSVDEGLSWEITSYLNQIAIGIESNSTITKKDTVIYDINKYYHAHTYQSVVVDKNNRIFLIGGFIDNTPISAITGYRNSRQSNSNLVPTTDVWTGKLNRKSFLRQ